MKRFGAALTLLFLLPAAGRAQSTTETEAPSYISSPVDLAAPEARPAFARGLLALHNFWYPEARRSFREAQSADPGFTLAYWGEALAHHNPFGFGGGDLDSMHAVMNRLAPSPKERAALARTERERRYLAAMEALMGEGEGKKRHRAYARELRKLVDAHPDDIEARALYALSLWGVVPSLRADTALREESARAAQAVLDRDPRHPGGLHYLIHALDSPETAERALYAARTYDEVAAGASHAMHMPSHIFIQLGMWDEVVEGNRRAFAASDAWVRREGESLARRDYHARDFMVYGLLQLGRYEAVEEILDEMARLAEETGSGTLRYYHAAWGAQYVVESGRWRQEPLPRSGYDARPELLGVGLNAVRTADMAGARGALATMKERSEAAEAEGGPHSIRTTRWRIAAAELEAAILLEEGSGDEAVRLLSDAIAWQDHLPPANETPDPIKPPEELLGETLLALGRWESAIEAFGRSLQTRRQRAASQLGLARAAARAGDVGLARAHYRALVRQWSKADAQLPELQEARRYLVVHPDDAPRPPIPSGIH